MKIKEDISKNYLDHNNKKTIIDEFKIDFIMVNLKNAVNKNSLNLEDYDDIVWLLKYVLNSDEIFPTTKEVNLLLENLCGFAHNTKSTGRDRIINWYFKELHKLENIERWNIIKKIAKYSFINTPNDFKGWNKILNKKGK